MASSHNVLSSTSLGKTFSVFEMSKVQMVRSLVNQRLTAAAEEIFGLFERTIAEYEEELRRSKEKNERQQKLLDAVLKPEVRLHRADIQQLVVIEEEVPPEQQEWSPSLDREDPPEPPHIKSDGSSDCEKPKGVEGDTVKTSVSSSECATSSDHKGQVQQHKGTQTEWRLDQEDPPEPPHIKEEQMETGADGEDCGGPEPARNSHLDPELGPETEDKTEDSSEAEYGDENWSETIEDIQQLNVSVEEVPPEQQEWSPSLDQEDPPEPPHIKEEQEELWTSQEGEQLQGLEEADITKFLFTPVPVKSEDDEEKPQSSQLHQRQTEQMETGADGEDCGGPEPARNSHPDPHLQPETEDNQEITEAFNSDMRCNTDENRFSCSVCGDGFKQKSSLKLHMVVHTGERPFSCSICGKGFPQKGKLTKHMAVHTGAKPFSCSVCGKQFTQKGNLTLHMVIHTGESSRLESLKARECLAFGLNAPSSASNPVKREMKQREKPFSCPFCGYRFTLKGSLRQHMAVHTGEVSFSCSICGKIFTRKQSLKQHICVHTRVQKPVSCSICGKEFTQRGLRIHMAVHTGEKPVSCSICGKEFTQRGLRMHMAVHTGAKPFRCSVCGKGFTQKEGLTLHMVVHSEESFSCPFCDRSFRQKTHLTRHIALHTGVKSYSCSVCGKKNILKKDLNLHMRIHSGEKPSSH